MTQFGQDSKPANGKRLEGLEALELPPSNKDLDAIAQRRDRPRWRRVSRDRRQESPLCEPDLVIGRSILLFVRNSTPQHYDAVEIVELGTEKLHLC